MGELNGSLPSSTGRATDDRFWENAVRLSSKRLEVIASNIANADTPNYKARDFDFGKALEQSLSNASLAESAAAPGKQPPDATWPQLLFRVSLQQGVDGNTVDLDVERAAFTETAIHYEFAMQKAVDEYKEIGAMFKNLSP